MALFQKILIRREKYLMVIFYIYMYVKVDVMKGVLSFRILVGIPPYP
jgi:hypothetical protein